MGFKSFLEAEVTPLSFSSTDDVSTADSVFSIIKEKCSNSLWMLENEIFLYRGDKTLFSLIGKKWGVVDTRLSERKSQNTSNWYTLIIDNAPDYSKFPKRSKSLVCTTSTEVANAYSNNNGVVAVIPFNNCKIGSTNKNDMWSVTLNVNYSNISVDAFNKVFDLLHNNGVLDETWNGLVKFSEEVKHNDSYKKLLKKALQPIMSDYGLSFTLVKDFENDFLGMIEKLYSPTALGLTYYSTKDLKEKMLTNYKDIEYWVGGDKVLVINSDLVYKLRNLL